VTVLSHLVDFELNPVSGPPKKKPKKQARKNKISSEWIVNGCPPRRKERSEGGLINRWREREKAAKLTKEQMSREESTRSRDAWRHFFSGGTILALCLTLGPPVTFFFYFVRRRLSARLLYLYWILVLHSYLSSSTNFFFFFYCFTIMNPFLHSINLPQNSMVTVGDIVRQYQFYFSHRPVRRKWPMSSREGIHFTTCPRRRKTSIWETSI
jgi:hypothetical protein